MGLSRIITATIFLGVMLLLHGVLKKFINKSFFLLVWTFVFLYLLIPLQIPSPTSIYNTEIIDRAPVAIQSNGQEAPLQAETQFISADTGTTDSPEKAGRQSHPYVKRVIENLPVILWIAGSVTTALFFLQAYRREVGAINYDLVPVSDGALQEMIESFGLKRKTGLYLSDKVSSPVTYGILRPKIVLPFSGPEKDLDGIVYILVHEMTHIRRFDLILKYIGLGALCIHWFNPLVWLAYRQMCLDIEISCDEQVLEWLEDSDKSRYAMTLIAMAEQQRSLKMSVLNTFGEQPIKERVLNIMTYRKTKFVTSLMCAILMVGSVSVFATTATKEVLVNYQDKMKIDVETITAGGISITPLQAVSDGEQTYISLNVDHRVFGDNEEGRHLNLSNTEFWVDGQKLTFDSSINNSYDFEKSSRLTSRSHYRLTEPYDPLFKDNGGYDDTLILNEDGTVSDVIHGREKTCFLFEHRDVDVRGKVLTVKINTAAYNDTDSLTEADYQQDTRPTPERIEIEGPWEFDIEVNAVNGPLKYNVSAQRDFRGDMFYIDEVMLSHYYLYLSGIAELFDPFEPRESRFARLYDEEGNHNYIPIILLDKNKEVILAMDGRDKLSFTYRNENDYYSEDGYYEGYIEYDFGYLIDPEDVYYVQLDDVLIPLR